MGMSKGRIGDSWVTQPGRFPVIVKVNSGNAKTGKVIATYAPHQSCPQTCELLPKLTETGLFADKMSNRACFAACGPMAMVMMRVNQAAVGLDPLAIAGSEAAQLDAVKVTPGMVGRPIRLHTAGDCSTNAAAQLVSDAATRLTERGAGQAWSYTHAGRVVDRKSWGSVSVLGSVSSDADAETVASRGYAVAQVMGVSEAHRRSKGKTSWNEGDRHFVICPAISAKNRGKSFNCTDCSKLCRNDTAMIRSNTTVVFPYHGFADPLPIIGNR